MDNLSKRALILKEIFRQLEPGSFLDIVSAPPDAYKVLMRDGRMLLARLDQHRNLRLDEIDGVC